MRIAIFGIGNVLIGDDAVGPTVVSLLDALYDFPENVVVEDLGTPSLDLAGRLVEFDAVLLVDAVSAQLPPGSIRMYTLEEMLRHPPGLRLSPHDPSLKETLLTVQFLGIGPKEIKLIGIVPESIESFGLTDVVQAAVPRAVEAVIRELAKLGTEVRLRETPKNAAPWWQAA